MKNNIGAFAPHAVRDADLLSVLTEGVVVSDPEGNVLYMNDSALAMHGMTSIEQAQRRGADYLPDFELHTLRGEEVPYDEWPISRIIRHERFSNLRFRVTERATGTARFLSYSGTPVYAEGVYAYALLTIHNVTEEELALERLRTSERRLRTALSAMPHTVVIYGPDLRVQYMNEAALANLGMEAEQAIGTSQAEWDAPGIEPFMAMLRQALDTCSTVRAVVPFLGREYEVAYVPILDERGEVDQILGVGRDLTEENRTIRELKSFAYAVSHDLKGPVRAVTGFSEVLIEDFGSVLPPEAGELLGRITRAGLRMSALLDDLLKLSRVSVEQFNPEEIDLVALAKTAFTECSGHERIRFTSPVRILVRGDRGLLGIAIGNLIQNAVKFSAGVDSPQIELGLGIEAGRHIYYVRDNGIGFDAASAKDMFKPFCRLHDDKEITGTGIGLAIVDRVIERHGGRVWAHSRPGNGACFYFSLPSATRAVAEPAA